MSGSLALKNCNDGTWWEHCSGSVSEIGSCLRRIHSHLAAFDWECVLECGGVPWNSLLTGSKDRVPPTSSSDLGESQSVGDDRCIEARIVSGCASNSNSCVAVFRITSISVVIAIASST